MLLGATDMSFTLAPEWQIYQLPCNSAKLATLNPFSTQLVFVPGIALAHVQHLALGLAELHEVCKGPPLKFVQVLLNGIPSFCCVDHITQLGVISKPAKGELCPSVPVSMLPKKMLNITSPDTNHRGTPLVTGLHLDYQFTSVTSSKDFLLKI
ncbi:hypothetical protein DUI87_08104 [Hirundo rustica rustica]|uniref:Uncharacterized protein n=1 Tax=Hirundo rustica rustica TaxID=333673 RepID=A0A3M0KRJ5_HIRRU|nr:hypothetical protein DUI87_08104 [Hirundo rustica rustica]